VVTPTATDAVSTLRAGPRATGKIASPMIAGMDLGDPISYGVLVSGTKVFSSDRAEIGTVVHVLADEAEDIFDGIVIDERTGPGGHRFADADQIDAIFTLRRGLQQMPPQAGMEWLIKRIQNTANNDTLLAGL